MSKGCTQPTACNFDPGANEDDGSCGKVDNCGICDNNLSNDCVQDCAGIWGGGTSDAECGDCFSHSGEYDCLGNCCMNNLIFDLDLLEHIDEPCWRNDHCDVCDTNSENDCVQDCAGIWGGNHEADENGFTIIESWAGQDLLYCEDLFTLQMIIDENDFSITPSAQNITGFHAWDLNANSSVDPWEFGEQNWSEGGRLTLLKVDIPFTITDDIGALTELRELILENSGLSAIPDTIANIKNLKTLNITGNSISLLPDRISELTNLEKMIVSKNNLANLPENFGNLTNLKILDAGYNSITTLPESIGSLNNLNHLFLENNNLDSLPATFGNLSSLIELRLQKNQLISLPTNFGSFEVLLNLYLNYNQLTDLPEDFGNMYNLQKLYLNNNNLDSLPTSIGAMENLEELWLHKNQILILPNEIGNLGSLITLYLQDNSLQYIPESISNLESLKELKLNDNYLYGLPQSLCCTDGDDCGVDFYDGLEIFSVSDNSLCPGSYPLCIPPRKLGSQECTGCPPNYFLIEGYCAWEPDYIILDAFLNANEHSQSLPFNTGIPYDASECVNEDWWDAGRLVEISFYQKELTSEIPENIGDLDRLEVLRLNSNSMIGEIPENLTNLTRLKILKLNSNMFSGSIPENIGALSNLDTLRLDFNKFTGVIPSNITELDKLTYLNLNQNHLTGSIPDHIGDMDSLYTVYLEENALGCYNYDFECDPVGIDSECCVTHCDDTPECNGYIPQSISNLKVLIRLYLYNNFLSGPIPGDICNIYDINEDLWLYLNNNWLCPGAAGYPDCIPEEQLGPQYQSECSD